MNKITEKAIKLYNLTKSSNHAEAAAAKNRLDALVEQHSINLDELIESKLELRISYKNNQELSLFTQCAAFLGLLPVAGITHYKKLKVIEIRLSTADSVRLKDFYEFHLQQMRKEIKKYTKNIKHNLMVAYVHKHDLFSKESSDQKAKSKPDKKTDYSQVLAMTESMEDVQYFKKLNS